MSTLIRDLIQLRGINNEFPENPKAFTEILVEDIMTIPEKNPDIDQIIQVIVSVDVKNKRLIKTPIGKSCSGKIMTGNKIVLEGIIYQRIVYVADEEAQPLHATECQNNFYTFIAIPRVTHPLSNIICNHIIIEPYVEDIYVKKLDRRSIEKSISLFINASCHLSNIYNITHTYNSHSHWHLCSYKASLFNK